MAKGYLKSKCPRCGQILHYARPQTRKENCQKCFITSNGKKRITVIPY